jgi:hypothetical protein
MDDVEILFPILWALSDNLVIRNNQVEFIGSVSEVLEFKALLLALDPTFSRGHNRDT